MSNSLTGVRVAVGPVIGRVTFESVIVLLEVTKIADITCFISIVDDVSPEGRLVAEQSKTLPANRPVAFKMEGLSVGQTYRVCFGGLHRADAEMCVGTFKTFDPSASSFCMLAVSLDKVRSVCASALLFHLHLPGLLPP
jgi:hypothetical protein